MSPNPSTSERQPGASEGASGTPDSPSSGASPSGSAGGDPVAGVKQKVQQAAGKAKEQVADRLDEQKQKATDTLSGVADALRSAGDRLGEGDGNVLAQYAHVAADQVERFTRGLGQQSVGDVLRQVEGFARREPALFAGGAFLLGLFGARFLKASAPDGGARFSGDGGAYSGRSVDKHGYPLVAHTAGAEMPAVPGPSAGMSANPSPTGPSGFGSGASGSL